jgi:hypothetical protein
MIGSPRGNNLAVAYAVAAHALYGGIIINGRVYIDIRVCFCYVGGGGCAGFKASLMSNRTLWFTLDRFSAGQDVRIPEAL